MEEIKKKEMKQEEIKEQSLNKRSNKKAIIITTIVLIIIVCLGISGYLYIKNNDKKLENSAKQEMENSITLEDKTYEYGTEIKVSDFNLKYGQKLYVNDTEITSESFKLDKLGDNQVKITSELIYKDTFKKEHKMSYERRATYEVEDKTPPEITGNVDKTIAVGDTIDIKSSVKAADNVDGEVEVKVEGTVDTNTEGQYKIKYIAEDKSGNRTEKENTITVNKKQEAVKETTTNTSSLMTSNSTKSRRTTKSNTNKKTSTKSNSDSSNSNVSSNENSTSTKQGRLKIATAEAKRVISQITNSNMSDYDKAYEIFNYLYSNVSLQTDQSNEAYKTNYGNEAYAALILKKAACSGYCKAVTLMCNAAGLQSKHINANKWEHQYNEVYAGGRWIKLDAQGGIFDSQWYF